MGWAETARFELAKVLPLDGFQASAIDHSAMSAKGYLPFSETANGNLVNPLFVSNNSN